MLLAKNDIVSLWSYQRGRAATMTMHPTSALTVHLPATGSLDARVSESEMFTPAGLWDGHIFVGGVQSCRATVVHLVIPAHNRHISAVVHGGLRAPSWGTVGRSSIYRHSAAAVTADTCVAAATAAARLLHAHDILRIRVDTSVVVVGVGLCHKIVVVFGGHHRIGCLAVHRECLMGREWDVGGIVR